MFSSESSPMLDCHTIIMDRNKWNVKANNTELAPNCPRCASTNTKFCYYNNYSLSQPRYFCKGCRRYWTKGGSLRNVPVGGGCRKSRRSKSARQAQQQRSSNGHSFSGTHHVPSDAEEIDVAAVFAKFLNQGDHQDHDHDHDDQSPYSGATSSTTSASLGPGDDELLLDYYHDPSPLFRDHHHQVADVAQEAYIENNNNAHENVVQDLLDCNQSDLDLQSLFEWPIAEGPNINNFAWPLQQTVIQVQEFETILGDDLYSTTCPTTLASDVWGTFDPLSGYENLPRP